jgi:hypothetical protein
MDILSMVMAGIAVVLAVMAKLATKTKTTVDDDLVQALQDPRVQEVIRETLAKRV